MIEIKNSFMDSPRKRIDKVSKRVNGHKLGVCTTCKGDADGDSLFMCKRCTKWHSEQRIRAWRNK